MWLRPVIELWHRMCLLLRHDFLVLQIRPDLLEPLHLCIRDLAVFVALARLNDVGPFKTIELVVEIYYVDRMHKVNECEAYATSRLDVLWQVEVVVNLGELLVYHAEQIFLLEPDRDVSNHESGLREHLLVII